MFQRCRSKVKFTEAILGKTCHSSRAFICELILHFSFVCPMSRSQMHMAEEFITCSDCLVFCGFFLTDLHCKCLVQQYLERVGNPEFKVQGQGNSCYFRKKLL